MHTLNSGSFQYNGDRVTRSSSLCVPRVTRYLVAHQHSADEALNVTFDDVDMPFNDNILLSKTYCNNSKLEILRYSVPNNAILSAPLSRRRLPQVPTARSYDSKYYFFKNVSLK